MNNYLVKFKNNDNEIHIITVNRDNKQQALETLIDCKEIILSHKV